jgi:hypothetical protein
MARNPKLRLDANEVAFRTLQAAVGEIPKPEPPGAGAKHPEAVKRGAKGGKKGGKARAASLTKKRRSAIATKGAQSRWKPKRDRNA